jgi:hypothetical protein
MSCKSSLCPSYTCCSTSAPPVNIFKNYVSNLIDLIDHRQSQVALFLPFNKKLILIRFLLLYNPMSANSNLSETWVTNHLNVHHIPVVPTWPHLLTFLTIKFKIWLTTGKVKLPQFEQDMTHLIALNAK